MLEILVLFDPPDLVSQLLGLSLQSNQIGGARFFGFAAGSFHDKRLQEDGNHYNTIYIPLTFLRTPFF